MSFGTAIVAIIAIIAFAAMRIVRYNLQHNQQPPVDERLLRERYEEIAQLRERVQVLERIVTEDRDTRAIADEIESLRDR